MAMAKNAMNKIDSFTRLCKLWELCRKNLIFFTYYLFITEHSKEKESQAVNI